MSASGGFGRHNTAVVALAFLLGGAAVGLAFEAVTPAPGPRVKTVAVVVAAKDLHLGTPFTKDNIEELTTTKRFPKDGLPEHCVISKSDLIGKRLYRMAHNGECFKQTDVKYTPHTVFGHARVFTEIEVNPTPLVEHLGPHCKVDIIAIFNDGNRREVFTLLPDIYIADVEALTGTTPKRHGTGPTMFAFSVNEEQLTLLDLATAAKCQFELALRLPDSPKRYFEFDSTLARVKGLVPLVKPKTQPSVELVLAPAPRIKPIAVIPTTTIAPAPRGMQVVTVSTSMKRLSSGFIIPGSRVDLLASAGASEREAFVLLPDLQVVAVNHDDESGRHQLFPERKSVSVMVNEKQAALFALANERECNLELVLRHPDSPRRDFDIEKSAAMVKKLPKKPELPIAPAPRSKG